MYHFELGRIFERIGAKEDAKKEYKRALTLNPEFKLVKEALYRISKRAAIGKRLRHDQ